MPGDLSKLYKKIGATRANINFLTRCRKYKLTPKGFLSKSRISTIKSNKMELRFSRIRMREMLKALHAKLFLLELDRKTHPQRESYKLPIDHLKKKQDREYFTKMKKLNKKFSQMMIEQKHRPKMQYKLDAVINQSKKELSEDETRVLARGFKFRPSLKELPIKDIVVGTEAYIKTAKVAQEIANHMRSRVAKEIDRMQAREKRRPTKQNMTTKEWVAVHKLKADTDRIIIPADKGDKSIVMEYSLDKEEHNSGKHATWL